jgi:subfamily B ATP-binding cassette protein MsbA
MAAVIMLYDPVKKLSRLNNTVQQGLAATDRIFDIIETDSDVQEPTHPKQIGTGNHAVTFQKVWFRYDKTDVLKNICLNVKAGEIVALAGMSGGGKTSLINLIPRFYDVSEGAVLIDDVDIRDIEIKTLRSRIALVTQEPILFNDTIFNNIAYGNRNASLKEVEDAARAAYAYDFIQSLPDKFETHIGELGSRLSGGEKQRLCIARAILKNAPILILDEATSSLDSESELLVQKALENLMQGRTTLIIAHRLSTIGYAHRIVVIVHGQIVEEGSHEELLSRQGEYAKLYRMQFAKDQG